VSHHLPLLGAPRQITLTIDGREAKAPEGSTILDACRSLGIDVPTFCFAKNLTPVNACRACVVEVEGARTLAAACSRRIEPGMVVLTDSPRVRLSRRVVLELLGSSVDMSASADFAAHAVRYQARPERLAGATVARPPLVDNELFVRDMARCMLCYRCVEACGLDAQATFAISAAGRGFSAHIAVEREGSLVDSACVFCGNCVGACPTSALMPKSEFDLRSRGEWEEPRQSQVDTICPYCGVGCTLRLHVQDNAIVKVTSPPESEVTAGHLCVKGRFGFAYVQRRPGEPGET
jgi:predicted molibdopterin-dependent oxidoreductase YjgC